MLAPGSWTVSLGSWILKNVVRKLLCQEDNSSGIWETGIQAFQCWRLTRFNVAPPRGAHRVLWEPQSQAGKQHGELGPAAGPEASWRNSIKNKKLWLYQHREAPSWEATSPQRSLLALSAGNLCCQSRGLRWAHGDRRVELSCSSVRPCWASNVGYHA